MTRKFVGIYMRKVKWLLVNIIMIFRCRYLSDVWDEQNEEMSGPAV